MKTFLFAAAALAAAVVSAPAAAQGNLISNGDFSDGLSSWTTSQGQFQGVSGGAFSDGTVGGYGTLSQTFAATAGSTLTLDYDLDYRAGAAYVTFNGVTVPGSVVSDIFSGGGEGPGPLSLFEIPANPTWPVHFSFNLGTALASNTLTFFNRNDPSYNRLDNVVVAVSAGPVPEPATWALMIMGFGLVGGALRSRRRTAAAQPA